MITISEEPHSAPALFPPPPPARAIRLRWLGQAGFAIATPARRLLIDPYLSDHLAKKYAGTEFPHTRMMPPPARPEEVAGVHFVLCTHRHSDHMDPGTLPIIAECNPACRFVVPRAEYQAAVSLGLPEERVIGMNAGEEILPADDLCVKAIPAAHEELQTNELGENHFLGYILTMGGIRVYHSGDCVPYPGLSDRLGKARIDVALLPVNGRDAFRAGKGVPGNFTLDEAAALCRENNIPYLIPHHFGMFEFNTLSPEELAQGVEACGSSPLCIVPKMGRWIEIGVN